MRVKLSGFNVEREVLDQLCRDAGATPVLTPEVFSAAYARISRSPKGAEALRREARQELAKARKSNLAIIFEMGHHSVAEHAVFNFDIVGVTRLAVEEVERFRLASYTEKSQRYQKLEGDTVVPAELTDLGLGEDLTRVVTAQNRAYREIYDRIVCRLQAEEGGAPPSGRRRLALENRAKEDARYVTSLSTPTQLGATFNARSLELLLRRFASHPLAEVRRLGSLLHDEVKEIAPSVILFHEANDYDRLTYPELAEAAASRGEPRGAGGAGSPRALLVDAPPDGDAKLGAALLHRVTGATFAECRAAVARMGAGGTAELVRAACRRMELYDAVLREFEHLSLTYELTVSASCFAQLKRHRMATLTCQRYEPALGIEVPPLVTDAGAEALFREAVGLSLPLYERVLASAPDAAPYCLTNSHRRRVLMTLNLRELYHFARLRQDAAAQWDIRALGHDMVALARKAMPIASLLLCGKDAYPEEYLRVFGAPPRVVRTVLPGHEPKPPGA